MQTLSLPVSLQYTTRHATCFCRDPKAALFMYKVLMQERARSYTMVLCKHNRRKRPASPPKGRICQVYAIAGQACCGLLCQQRPSHHFTNSLTRPPQPTSNDPAQYPDAVELCGSACRACTQTARHCKRCQPVGDTTIPYQTCQNY